VAGAGLREVRGRALLPARLPLYPDAADLLRVAGRPGDGLPPCLDELVLYSPSGGPPNCVPLNQASSLTARALLSFAPQPKVEVEFAIVWGGGSLIWLNGEVSANGLRTKLLTDATARRPRTS